MSAVQIGIIGIAGVLLALQFKNGKTEYGIYISLAVSIVIFFSIADKLTIVVETIRTLSGYINIGTVYLSTLFKMIGITYIAEFSTAICKDAGYQTIASQIDVFSKLTILTLSMPILAALLETIHSFLA